MCIRDRLQLVVGNQQRLAVVGKLDLGAEHVDAGRGPGIVLVLGQLVQGARRCV